jgi:predicted phage terminase large subunit-like protein
MIRGHCAMTRDRLRSDYNGAASFVVGIEEEGGASGKIAARALVTNLYGFHVQSVRPDGNKATRAKPAGTQAQYGNIHYLRAPWNREFFDELYAFNGLDPGKGGAAHDDMADAFSGAFNLLAQAGRVQTVRAGRMR